MLSNKIGAILAGGFLSIGATHGLASDGGNPTSQKNISQNRIDYNQFRHFILSPFCHIFIDPTCTDIKSVNPKADHSETDFTHQISYTASKNQADIRNFFLNEETSIFTLESFNWSNHEIEMFRSLSLRSKKALTELHFTGRLTVSDLINLESTASIFPDLKVIQSKFIEVDSINIEQFNALASFDSLETIETELLNILPGSGQSILNYQTFHRKVLRPCSTNGIKFKYKAIQGAIPRQARTGFQDQSRELYSDKDAYRVDVVNIGYIDENSRKEISEFDIGYKDKSIVYASIPLSGEKILFKLFSKNKNPSKIVIITKHQVKIFDANSYKPLASYQHHFEKISSVGFSPDESLIAISESNQVNILDILSGDTIHKIHSDYCPDSVDINANHSKILLSTQGILSEIRLSDNKELSRWKINTSSRNHLRHSGYISDQSARLSMGNLEVALPLNSPYFNIKQSSWIGTPIATRDLLRPLDAEMERIGTSAPETIQNSWTQTQHNIQKQDENDKLCLNQPHEFADYSILSRVSLSQKLGSKRYQIVKKMVQQLEKTMDYLYIYRNDESLPEGANPFKFDIFTTIEKFRDSQPSTFQKHLVQLLVSQSVLQKYQTLFPQGDTERFKRLLTIFTEKNILTNDLANHTVWNNYTLNAIYPMENGWPIFEFKTHLAKYINIISNHIPKG